MILVVSDENVIISAAAARTLVGLSGCLPLPPPLVTGGGSFNAGAFSEAGNFLRSLDPLAFTEQFDEVVDAVAELDANPHGEQAIDGVLNSALSSEAIRSSICRRGPIR